MKLLNLFLSAFITALASGCYSDPEVSQINQYRLQPQIESLKLETISKNNVLRNLESYEENTSLSPRKYTF